MSMKLRDLIRMVRSCKTAAEERAVISKECALIRTAIREENETYRSRNVAKLMYIHMLGYPTHFGQMECLKLVSAPSFPDKRVGYLALTILLTENTEVLTLVTNSLKVDLSSANQYIQALSLVAIGNLATQDMARDLTSDVEKILRGMSSYLKKKAALATIRLVKKEPDLIEHLTERIVSLLKDRTHGVLISGIELIIQVLQIEPDCKASFLGLVPGLVRLLRNFSSMGYSPEHDVNGVTDPFLQVKIIQLLGILGENEDDASDQMNDVLAQVATNTETNKNAGNAILYECVKTIMTIRSDSALKTVAINILGRFLLNRDNNIRYVALNSLSKVIREDPTAVQRHRSTILECLKDVDISIRQRALDLSFQLVNVETVEAITTELLNYLVVAQHKEDLIDKIMIICERFAPSRKWRLDTLATMLMIAGNVCPESVSRLAIIFIGQSEELRGYAAHKLYNAVLEDRSQYSLNFVSSWCMGEYGELLLQPCPSIDGSQSYDPLDPMDIVTMLKSLMVIHSADMSSKSLVLNALMKLSVRCSDTNVKTAIIETISPLSKSLYVELQQRATEYILLLNSQWDSLRPDLLARMPVLDEATMRAKRAEWNMTSISGGSNGDLLGGMGSGPATNGTPINGTDDVLNLLGSPVASIATAPSSAGGTSTASGLLDLDDIFGSPSPTPAPGATMGTGITTPPQPPSTGGGGSVDMLADVFGASTTLSPTPIPSSNTVPPLLTPSPGVGPSVTPVMSGTDDLLGSLSAPASSAPTPTATAPQSVIAFDKNGLTISMDLSKPDPLNPAKTELLCRFGNSTTANFTGLQFQAAVPKYLKLELKPPSSSTVSASSQGKTTQVIVLTNNMQGEKSIMLKLKIAYSVGGSKIEEMAQVNSFPPLY
jgi:AP-1 complex subunit gamma-1